MLMNFRIKRKKEIQNLLKTKQKLHTNILNFFYARNNFGYPRFVLIVSKKVSPKAFQRNRIRRQLRSMLRETNVPENFSIDIAIIVKPEFSTTAYLKNKTVLQKMFHKVLAGEK